MAYEMTHILQRCEKVDVEFIISIIDSYVNFTNDKELKIRLSAWNGKDVMPLAFAKCLEREIRYLGSSDIAYASRKLRGFDPAGVSADEIIEDICKALKISYKKVGSLENKLESLAKGVVDKAFFSKSPQEQIEIIKKCQLTEVQEKQLEEYIKTGKKIGLSILTTLIGKSSTMAIMNGIIYSILVAFIGKQAAEQLAKLIATKIPWLAAFCGPIAMVALSGWAIVDMCRPAMRKTIPIFLTLSLVSLRNGPEDSNFWNE